MIKKAYRKNSKFCRTTFRFSPEAAPDSADNVQILGDFNSWEGAPMEKRKNGTFSTTISLEVGKSYEFRYLVNDQEWVNDTEADSYVFGPFGAQNAVVEV